MYVNFAVQFTDKLREIKGKRLKQKIAPTRIVGAKAWNDICSKPEV
jgi:hypothetical protein